MLILTRKTSEKITIGEGITIMVVEIRGKVVRLGIEAPGMEVHRQEVYDAIHNAETRDAMDWEEPTL